MTKRDRRFIFGFFSLIVLLISGALWHVASYNQDQARQRKEAASYEVAHPNDVNKCAAENTTVAQFTCLSKTIAVNQEQERGRADLHAQQDMATWALSLLWVSAVGVLISGAGVWLVYSNLVALESQTNTSKDLSHKSTKAYLSVDKCIVIWPTKGERTKVVFTYKNSGQTPALNLRLVVHNSQNLHKHARAIDWDMTPARITSFGAVPGNETKDFFITLWEADECELTDSWKYGMTIGPSISGTVFYEDIYGVLHRSTFGFLKECTFEGPDDPRLENETEFPRTRWESGRLFEVAPDKYQNQSDYKHPAYKG